MHAYAMLIEYNGGELHIATVLPKPSTCSIIEADAEGFQLLLTGR